MDEIGVWGVVVVASDCADEGVYFFVGWVVNDCNTAFGICSVNFCNEEEVACSVDAVLYLWD